MNKTMKRYLTLSVIGLLGVYVVASLRGTFSMQGSELVANLCDSFTVPGAILVAIGGLLWVANDGFFDMISYGLKNGLHSLFPVYKLERKTFYDYKVEKMKKRDKGVYVAFLLTGLAFLAVAVILLIVDSLI